MTDKQDDKPLELPKYTSIRKETRALKISLVTFGPDGDATLTPANPNYEPVHVDKNFGKVYTLTNGGYFVTHEDGPATWVPADVFESHHEAADHTERDLKAEQEKNRNAAAEREAKAKAEPEHHRERING